MSCKIALIGEAYGEQESYYKLPFVGPAGKELDRMLEEAGIDRRDCLVTNVFNLRPPDNKLEALCARKEEGGVADWLPSPKPGTGLYLKREYLPEVDRLLAELRDARPNIAVLLGNTASWAVLHQTAITKIRGTCAYSAVLPELKCLATYHPAYVMRAWDDRHVAVLDLIKAKAQGEFPEIRRPNRQLWIEPTFEDILHFKEKYLDNAEEMAVDIETNRKTMITCIGFAPRVDLAICIPFADPRKPGGSYWPNINMEMKALALVKEICRLPARKVFQNGLFDIQHLWQTYGIEITNCADDTMLLHHSLLPEAPKSLDFLGSVYTDELAWKTHRPRGSKTNKKDD